MKGLTALLSLTNLVVLRENCLTDRLLTAKTECENQM